MILLIIVLFFVGFAFPWAWLVMILLLIPAINKVWQNGVGDKHEPQSVLGNITDTLNTISQDIEIGVNQFGKEINEIAQRSLVNAILSSEDIFLNHLQNPTRHIMVNNLSEMLMSTMVLNLTAFSHNSKDFEWLQEQTSLGNQIHINDFVLELEPLIDPDVLEIKCLYQDEWYTINAWCIKPKENLYVYGSLDRNKIEIYERRIYKRQRREQLRQMYKDR
ncbi:hypothetical protein [Moraxella marmotae]|uniref:hypothetical protein n=1 Tax=Moraxella marmotae TaxID=3344520 RepID=UPI0035F417A3